MVNGSRNVQLVPPLAERAAYQLPVWKTFRPLRAVLGSFVLLEKPDPGPPVPVIGTELFLKIAKSVAADWSDGFGTCGPWAGLAALGAAERMPAGPGRFVLSVAFSSAWRCCGVIAGGSALKLAVTCLPAMRAPETAFALP